MQRWLFRRELEPLPPPACITSTSAAWITGCIGNTDAPPEANGFMKRWPARRERTSVIAACQDGKLVAPLTFAGTCNTEVVDAYFAQVLLPVLPPGSVIVLDNARFHQSPTTAALVAAAGCALLFLPAYSPDLNPIEHLWAAVKTRLRQGLPTAANPALFVGITCLCYC